MKRTLALILCLVMLVSLAAGCGSKAVPAGPQTELSGGGSAVPEAEPEKEAENEPWFTFRPKVSSVFLDEIFPAEMVQSWMVQSWYNLVDAVMAGEDTFACPDQDTYDWMIHQFHDRCFPLLTEYIEPSSEPVENGIAHLTYTVPIEEFQQKLAEFEKLVEDIINETMRPEYTDLEKAMSLYLYFVRTYEYDYDTFMKMSDECPEYLSSSNI